MATVAIAVTSVNDAPVANGQSVITNEDDGSRRAERNRYR